MEAAGSGAQAGTGWALVSENSISSGLADKGMRVLLPGYGGALGSEAQLLAGQGIDFYQRAPQALVSGQAWGPESPGGLPGGSALSRALKEKPLGGLRSLKGRDCVSPNMPLSSPHSLVQHHLCARHQRGNNPLLPSWPPSLLAGGQTGRTQCGEGAVGNEAAAAWQAGPQPYGWLTLDNCPSLSELWSPHL